MESEDIKIVHALPGRIRLRVAEVKNNPGFAQAIKNCLSSIVGIRRVESNPLTGSLLVVFDPQKVKFSSLNK
ncbi:MAG: hypothetical protein PHW74_11995 [Desulfobacca sp.]|nr:hypothetical protein [Desulfobacca sp.]